MAATWSEAQVLALTNDSATLQNGKKLAIVSKWSNFGANDDAVWGECQGSGKDPYRVCIDRSDMGYKCNCPSHKFPCKHTIALFLLFANRADSFSAQSSPNWLTTWLDGRQKRRDKTEPSPEKTVDVDAQAKRQAAREDKTRAGMNEFRRWLWDIARHGLADDRLKTYEFWDRMAARMVDAQASGIARRLRGLGGLPFQRQSDWAVRMLDEISQLYLLSEGYSRIDSLPIDTQHDIRNLIGWTYKQDDLLSLPAVRDQWLVLSQYVENEERLKMRRVWLHGKRTGRTAMLLDFAHGSISFEGNFPAGHAFDAEVIYYPSAYPQRALLKTQYSGMTAAHDDFTGFSRDLDAIFEGYTDALAKHPWLAQFPIGLHAMLPFEADGHFYVRDAEGHTLPIAIASDQWWMVMAASGGHPLPIFGEWDGFELHLRTVHTDGRYFSL